MLGGTGSPGGDELLTVTVVRDEHGYGMKVSGDNPVYVQSVKEHGAAWRAGLRAGDRILRVDGVPVHHHTHQQSEKQRQLEVSKPAESLVAPHTPRLTRTKTSLDKSNAGSPPPNATSFLSGLPRSLSNLTGQSLRNLRTRQTNKQENQPPLVRQNSDESNNKRRHVHNNTVPMVPTTCLDNVTPPPLPPRSIERPKRHPLSPNMSPGPMNPLAKPKPSSSPIHKQYYKTREKVSPMHQSMPSYESQKMRMSSHSLDGELDGPQPNSIALQMSYPLVNVPPPPVQTDNRGGVPVLHVRSPVAAGTAGGAGAAGAEPWERGTPPPGTPPPPYARNTQPCIDPQRAIISMEEDDSPASETSNPGLFSNLRTVLDSKARTAVLLNWLLGERRCACATLLLLITDGYRAAQGVSTLTLRRWAADVQHALPGGATDSNTHTPARLDRRRRRRAARAAGRCGAHTDSNTHTHTAPLDPAAAADVQHALLAGAAHTQTVTHTHTRPPSTPPPPPTCSTRCWQVRRTHRQCGAHTDSNTHTHTAPLDPAAAADVQHALLAGAAHTQTVTHTHTHTAPLDPAAAADVQHALLAGAAHTQTVTHTHTRPPRPAAAADVQHALLAGAAHTQTVTHTHTRPPRPRRRRRRAARAAGRCGAHTDSNTHTHTAPLDPPPPPTCGGHTDSNTHTHTAPLDPAAAATCSTRCWQVRRAHTDSNTHTHTAPLDPAAARRAARAAGRCGAHTDSNTHTHTAPLDPAAAADVQHALLAGAAHTQTVTHTHTRPPRPPAAADVQHALLADFDKEEILRNVFRKARQKAKEEMAQQLNEFQVKRQEQVIVERLLVQCVSGVASAAAGRARGGAGGRGLRGAGRAGRAARRAAGRRALSAVQFLYEAYEMPAAVTAAAGGARAGFLQRDKQYKQRVKQLAKLQPQPLIIRGHHLQLQALTSEAHCHHCEHVIWGLAPQAYVCTGRYTGGGGGGLQALTSEAHCHHCEHVIWGLAPQAYVCTGRIRGGGGLQALTSEAHCHHCEHTWVPRRPSTCSHSSDSGVSFYCGSRRTSQASTGSASSGDGWLARRLSCAPRGPPVPDGTRGFRGGVEEDPYFGSGW
ncbi:hypothetical protein MSG28_015823 [Choristoneura fumiferana]|uniref:Uncharacterized protein n=1 Tax=Choristoneura fumiferana TaxID=7141 RepID=A0ACC0KCG3_CHOFU|nr:hypothetical protein MSG28_015823 [Choristoneura fumiferana]